MENEPTKAPCAVVIADDDGLVGHLEVGPVDLLISLGDLWDSTIEKAAAWLGRASRRDELRGIRWKLAIQAAGASPL